MKGPTPMPIFEYRCEECGKAFEEIVSSNQSEAVPCPVCASKKTEKLMSRIGGISMGKGGGDFACSSGAPCPGAVSCGAGGCCPHN
jgi:putative FmdB family regulatory protein